MITLSENPGTSQIQEKFTEMKKKKEKKWGSIPIIMMTSPFMISSKTKSWLVNWIKRIPELSYKKC